MTGETLSSHTFLLPTGFFEIPLYRNDNEKGEPSMKKMLRLFLAVFIVAALYTPPAAADCWNWSIDETTLAVTLTGHTPDTAQSVTVPDWYYPSGQTARDAIQAAVDSLKGNSLLGAAGSMAIVAAYESTGGLPVLAIGDNVFSHYTYLSRIDLPETITAIGAYAFWHCYALESFAVPQNVTSISEGTFASCVSLWDITLPYGLAGIGRSAFESCTALETIFIPETVTDIGFAAFSGCSSLRGLVLPDGLQSIGDYAFYECDSLEWIVIPGTVTSIGDNAFYGCQPDIRTTNAYAIQYAKDHGLNVFTN